MTSYMGREYCSSDCVNFACWRFVSEAVKQGAESKGQKIATADYSGGCPYYVPADAMRDDA